MKMKVKMRQVFGIILSLVLVLGLMPKTSIKVKAETATGVWSSGIDYSYDTATGVLTLTGNGSTTVGSSTVVCNPDDPFSSGINEPFSNISRIVISEGITSIGDVAIADWHISNDLTIEIPSTVTSIGSFAFSSLTRGSVSVIMNARPDNITTFNTNAFNGARNGEFITPYASEWKASDKCSYDSTNNTITFDNTYKGIFTLSVATYTVTYKVINGTWDGSSTADKTESVASGASPASVPTGMKANSGYTGGSWDTDPSTATISADTTFTYTFVADSSSGGDSSDSGSGSSSSGSTDSGSGSSSSSGTSDSGNTSGGTTSGSSDNTNTTTDTSAKIPYDSVPISTGSVNDITGTAEATAESNPFGTKIENSSNLTTLLSLTDAEVAQGVNVWLDVQDMSSSVSKTDKSLIQNKSGDYTVGLYLDINLFKKVGSNDATKVTETNGKIKASIVIPKKLRKSGRTFEIIRVHNGEATTITGTYIKKTHVFTFETDKFSTYAIAYKDVASSTDTESSDSSSTATTTSTTTTTTASTGSIATTATAPKTGDGSDMRVWLMFVIVSFAGLGVYAVSRKKRASK